MDSDQSTSRSGSSALDVPMEAGSTQMLDGLKLHSHQMMVRHGENRDDGHRFGGIPHVHAVPINLNIPEWLPRKASNGNDD